MKMYKKLLALVLVFVLGMSLLSGCTKKDDKIEPVVDDAVPEEKVPAEDEQVNTASVRTDTLVYNLGSEVKTLDPTLVNAVDGTIVLVNLYEGLVRTDGNEQSIVTPGVAESWEISDDGLVYTFYLRQDAKWSDGQPVTSGDFVYAWMRALDPAVNAESAYKLYPIQNAESYHAGLGAKSDELGIQAIDEHTLEVRLENPTQYFLGLTSLPIYFPLREDIVAANPERWTDKVETYVSNGKYKLVEIEPRDHFLLTKNEEYWNAADVKLANVDIKMVTDPVSAYESFQEGLLDMQNDVPPDEVEAGVANGSVSILPYIGTYFLCINMDGISGAEISPELSRALRDVRVREALSLAIDREKITKQVTRGGEIPAHGYIPDLILNTDGTPFGEREYFKPTADVARAKELMAQAGYPNGEGFPTLIYSYNIESFHPAVAEALQAMWQENLGIKVELQSAEWKVLQLQRNRGDFLVARDGFIGDYVDAMTFLDLWMSSSGQNSASYQSERYNDFVTAAKQERDPAKRDALMHGAEDVLMEDLPIIPIFYYTAVKAIQPYVSGLKVDALGSVYFDQVLMRE